MLPGGFEEAVLLSLSVEGAPGDPQAFGGQTDVPVGGLKGLCQKGAFDLLNLFDSSRLLRAKQGVRKMLRKKKLAFCQTDGKIDAVLEFTDVAPPGVGVKPIHHIGMEPGDVLVEFPGRLAQKTDRKILEILLSFPKGRKPDPDDVEPIKEICPEPIVSQVLF